MKKILCILTASLLLCSLALTACDAGDTSKESDTTAATEQATSADTTADTTATTDAATEADNKVTYTVTVKDQDGNPVVGARIQLCTDESCKMPRATDENGVVTFSFDEDTYKAQIASLPDGYTGDLEGKTAFPANTTEVTLTVTKN